MAKRDNSSGNVDFGTWVERLKQAGFTTGSRGNGTLISKYGCGAVIERSSSGGPQFAVRPGLISGSEIARLTDRGFQKFWQSGDRSMPALAEQLKALHKFEQDLRKVMGVTSLYNESLGTVSARYVYDRVDGREEPKRRASFD